MASFILSNLTTLKVSFTFTFLTRLL
jgi:hypothetical protein